MSPKNVNKALILAAGQGNRLRPFTNFVPKTMMPYKDKPLLYYQIERLRDVGINNIIIISREDEDANGIFRFQNNYIKQLANELKAYGTDIKIVYQKYDENLKKPKGTADALLSAEQYIDNSDYMVLLGDLLVENKENENKNFLENILGEFTGDSLVSVKKVGLETAKGTWIVNSPTKESKKLLIEDIIEKPSEEEVRNYGNENDGFITTYNGTYIMSKNSLNYIKMTKPVRTDEIKIENSIALQAKDKKYSFYGVLINDNYYTIDFGDINSWLSVNLSTENTAKFTSALSSYPEGFREKVYEFTLERFNKDLKNYQ